MQLRISSLIGLVIMVSNVHAAKPTLNFKTNSPAALPACEKEPSFLASPRQEISGGLKSLPPTLLVAREARFFIESRGSEGTIVRAQSYQSFLRSNVSSKARIICANSESPLQNRFSMMAPTLIDNHGSAASRNVFWQFQVLAENTLLSSWNTKSLAMSSKFDFEKTINKLGYDVKIYQLGINKIEILYLQKLQDRKQALSIVYDLD